MDFGLMRLIRAAILGVTCGWGIAEPVGAALEEGEPAPLLPGQQIADQPLEPFDPLVPATPEDDQASQARAWYMTGKIHEARGTENPDEFEKAAEAYRKSIELNPRALAGYEALIPVLYARNEKDEAREYALRAASESEAGFRIVRGLAAVMARGDSLAESVKLLEEAQANGTLDSGSVTYLLVHRDLGLYLHMSQRHEEAAESYQIVFEALLAEREPPLTDEQRGEILGGEPGTTYDEFGKTFLEAKLPDLAVRAFDEAARHREGRPGIHSFNLALVFRESGKPEEALSELQKYFDAQLQNKGRDAYQLLKDLLSDLQRSEELIPRLEALQQVDPRNAFLAYFLAQEYVAAGSLEKGEQLYTATLGTSNDPRGLVGLLPVYRQQRNGRKLVEMLGKIYPQMPEPESEDDLQKLPPDVRELVEHYQSELEALAADVEALDSMMQAGRDMEEAEPAEIDLPQAYMLGKVAVESKRTEDVVHFYKLTISMLNNPTLDVYRELGEYLIDQKQYTQSAEVFREAADHPAFAEARWIFLYFLTYPLEFDGKTDEALAVIAEARGSQPDNPQLHFQEAWIHYHAQQWDKAEALFKEVIDQYKSDPDNEKLVRNSQFSLSNVYVQRGDKAQGEKVLEDVLKEAPDDPQANNDLGYLWADDGRNLEQAKTMIEKALAAEPENPAYLDSMGWVLYRLEQYAEARTHLEKAIAQENGEDSTIYDHYGDVLEKLGEQEAAVQAWTKALELEQDKPRPDEELLQKLRERVPQAAAAAEGAAP
jgi:tetratricopeptide (TPR) repeat protein